MSLFDPQRPQQHQSHLVTRSPTKRPFMGRREWVSVGMIMFALATVVLSISPDSCTSERAENLGDPLALREMPYPDLARLGDLPSPERISEYEAQIEEYLERPDRLYGQVDEILIGWAQRQLERDRDGAIMPLRVTPSDLLHSSIDSQFRLPNGARVAASGLILERHAARMGGDDNDNDNDEGDDALEDADLAELPGEQQWYRLLLEASDDIYFQALVRGQAAEFQEGHRVNLVGRYLSVVPVPVIRRDGDDQNQADTVHLFTMAADRGSRQTEQGRTGITRLLGYPGVEGRIGDGTFFRDDSILQDVDDNGIRLERRPYYYLLGLVSRDASTPGVYDDAQSAQRMEYELHHHAEDHRGDVFYVEGQVLRAWEDWDVGRDQPFGVNRVFRIWLWSWLPRTTEVEYRGETREIATAGVGVFEIAAIVRDDRELPEVGDVVSATGRFLKMQRYRRDANFRLSRGSLRDPDRPLSDSVYFKMLVTHEYNVTPPREAVSILVIKIGFLVVFASLLIFVMRLIEKERQHLDDYKKPMRRLRKGRRELRRKEKAAAAAGDIAVAEDADPGDQTDIPHGDAVADEVDSDDPSPEADPAEGDDRSRSPDQ